MKHAFGWGWAVAGLAQRLQWIAAWYRSARTTYEVVRLLDREQQLLAAAPAGAGARFVARPGYVI